MNILISLSFHFILFWVECNFSPSAQFIPSPYILIIKVSGINTFSREAIISSNTYKVTLSSFLYTVITDRNLGKFSELNL